MEEGKKSEERDVLNSKEDWEVFAKAVSEDFYPNETLQKDIDNYKRDFNKWNA